MLLLVSRALWHHRNNQIDGADFVVAIGSGEDDRDGSALLVDEGRFIFAPSFPLSLLDSCPLSRLPKEPRSAWSPSPATPADPAALPSVVLGHPPHQLLEEAHPPPPLETFVNDTGGDPEVVFVERLPLASRPEQVPDGVGDRPV